MQMIRLCFIIVCCISGGVLAVFMHFSNWLCVVSVVTYRANKAGNQPHFLLRFRNNRILQMLLSLPILSAGIINTRSQVGGFIKGQPTHSYAACENKVMKRHQKDGNQHQIIGKRYFSRVSLRSSTKSMLSIPGNVGMSVQAKAAEHRLCVLH